jgi:hypothetical protein
MTIIHHDPTLAQAVHDTATQKLNDPEWEGFPIDLLGDPDLGQRAFEVLQTLGYAREKTINEEYDPYNVDPEHDPWKADYIHPRAKEFLVRYGKEYVECLEAYMRLTNQPINRL